MCYGNPNKRNKNFKLDACKRLLGQDDIEEKYPWFVKSCWTQRKLKPSDGIQDSAQGGRPRGNGCRGNKRDQEETQPAQQQQQF